MPKDQLQQLLTAMCDAQTKAIDQFNKTNDDSLLSPPFSICINDVNCQFNLSAPEAQALQNFISSLASEYELTVDFKEGIITD
jgi:hypothetical protein